MAEPPFFRLLSQALEATRRSRKLALEAITSRLHELALEADRYADDDGMPFAEMGRIELWFGRESDTETHFVIRRSYALGQQTLMEGDLVHGKPPKIAMWRRGWESQLFLAPEMSMQPVQAPPAYAAETAH